MMLGEQEDHTQRIYLTRACREDRGEVRKQEKIEFPQFYVEQQHTERFPRSQITCRQKWPGVCVGSREFSDAFAAVFLLPFC